MTFRHLALCSAALLALADPAAALTFNFTTVANDTLTAEQAAAFQTAANNWSAVLSDAITVNLQVGFSSTLGTNVLGSTAPTIIYGTRTAVGSLLVADAKDANDRAAIATYSSTAQGNIAVTSAEGKALGGILPSTITSDGTIEFSTSFTFSTSRNVDGTVAAGTYDLIGIAEHEIGHLLGFVSSIDGGTSGYQTLLDQFRYSASNSRSVAAGTSAYFSLDSGATDLANFSTGIVNGSGEQASHWQIGTAGVMVPEAAAGHTQNISALDILALDVLGYDPVAVPEPVSLGLLLLGTAATVGTRRRRTA